jgi:hypothetical protein|tara:strand:+ start:543 stop:818 length:276 start_codon:yes stop_codon:yes gene_type:complete
MKKPRNYRKEYDNYQGTAEQKKNRAARNKGRKTMETAGRVSKGDGNHVNHVVPLSRGGSADASNLSVKKAKDNLSYARTSTGAMKKNSGKA